MALSAAGLEELASGYYKNLDVGAKDLTAEYEAAAAQAALQRQAAESGYIDAQTLRLAEQEHEYQALRENAQRMSSVGTNENTDIKVPYYEETATAKAMRKNALGDIVSQIAAAEKGAAENIDLNKRLAEQQGRNLGSQLSVQNTGQFISAQSAEDRQGASRELGALSSLGNIKSSYNSAKLQEDALAQQKALDAYNNAMTELNTFGVIMTKDAAEAIGMPIGTKKSALIGGGKGGGKGTADVKVTNFYSAFDSKGNPRRKTYLYNTEDEFNAELENAVASGSNGKVLVALQNGVYDGFITPKQAQAAFNEFNAANEKSVAKGRTGRLKYGDY